MGRPVMRAGPSLCTVLLLCAFAPSIALAQERRPTGEVEPAGSASPDSMMRALIQLPGYTATVYSGTAVSFDADSGIVDLVGAAELERAGQTINADSLLTFDLERNVVCGYGSPVLSGEGQPLNSEQICYDVEQRVGMAVGAATEFTEQATWYVHGEQVYTVGDDRLYSSDAEFTTCDLEIPHYHFEAEQFKIVNNSLLVARDVTLNFSGVPVFWLPFLVQSLREGRRSGLLTPSFSITDVVQTGSNQRRQISNLGYYWAINDYMGAEAAFGWRSDEWVSARMRFDYVWLRQFLRGNINAQQYWRDGSTVLAVNTSNSWQPDERTNVGISGQYTSSSDFVRRQSYRPEELDRSMLANASIGRQFDWGRVNIGASRNQRILEDHVTLSAPSVDVSVHPITLATVNVGGAPEELTWHGTTGFSSRYEDRSDRLPETPAELQSFLGRDSRLHDARLSSSLSFGKFSWSQSINGSDTRVEARPLFVLETDTTLGGADTLLVDSLIALPEEQVRDAQWRTSLSYTQNLIGTSTLAPHVTLRGEFLESPATGGRMITSPVSLDFGARLKMDVYGFWRGVGPFERFRHRLSPAIAYTYSPEPDLTPLDSLFGGASMEQNGLQLSLTQTFEAKRRADPDADTATTAAAAGAGGVAGAGRVVGEPDEAGGLDGEPREMEQEPPLMLLSVTTTALSYDFAEANRGGHGLTTTRVSNTLRSDLLRNVSIRITHDLFETEGLVTGETRQERHFDPHLSNLSANFGFGGDSWLFRWLGLGGDMTEQQPDVSLDSIADEPVSDDGSSGIVPGDEDASDDISPPRAGATGTWRASVDYSLSRPRLMGAVDALRNQQIGLNMSFQPTINWNVNWGTQYSITESEFISNSLNLTRDLHRWRATFTLARAQNGNFVFRFEASLSDLPDLRIPYDQRSRPRGSS